MIKKISNLSENLIIIIIVGSLCGGIGYFAGSSGVAKGQKITLEQVQPTLDKAIEKATNEITNKIEVPKIKKSEGIQLIMTPNNEQIAVRDTCIWAGVERLSERRKNRIKGWLKQ